MTASSRSGLTCPISRAVTAPGDTRQDWHLQHDLLLSTPFHSTRNPCHEFSARRVSDPRDYTTVFVIDHYGAVTWSGVDCYTCQVNLCRVGSDTQFMARKELRHNRHTVPLLTDHKVITPKYRGKILVEKMIALAVEGIIRTTCKEMKIGIIDKALECGSCSSVCRAPSESLLSGFIAKKIKRRRSRELRKAFPHLTEWCEYRSLDAIMFSWLGWPYMGCCGEMHTESGEAECEIRGCTSSVLKSGVW